MAINLANVNLTIRQFQEISSGKYNAGEVRLATDHSLGKINHHVGMTGLNKVSISHAETLAVKDAFIRALSQNGVAADELDRVRKELGLAPDGAVDTALAQRSIRPLTREQIRAILDRNADTINQANNGQEIIRTEAQLHERFSERERADIVRTRNQANAALMQRRALLPDRRIVDAQNVIAGNIHYCDKAERERLITAAERQRACILDRSHGNPSNAPGATMVFQVPGTGQTLTLSLGMSEADYLKKLDDMLLVLRGDRHPSDAVLEVRNEFRTLASQGQAALARWVTSLANDPQGAFKARTIAVSLLFDGGVSDWETLSLVNRISDFAAIALVSYLVNHRDPDLRGDALRQSAAVTSLAQQIDPQAVPAANQTCIPALSPREAKSAAYDALYYEGKTPTHEMKTMGRNPCRVQVALRGGRRSGGREVQIHRSGRRFQVCRGMRHRYPQEHCRCQGGYHRRRGEQRRAALSSGICEASPHGGRRQADGQHRRGVRTLLAPSRAEEPPRRCKFAGRGPADCG